MKGGYEKVVPMYNEPKNSPFIPNIQKEIYNENLMEKGIHPSQKANNQNSQDSRQPKGNPLVNLQVYQPTKPKPPDQKGPMIFQQPTASTPFFPPQFAYQMPPYLYNGNVNYHPQGQMNVPIINTYNINIDNVNGDPGKISLIYEDMMPNISGRTIGTMATIGERTTIYNYIKSMMFSSGDGMNVSLDGKGDNSLLSHLKFMDLNPYNTYKLSPNPYKGLPNNFLIYKSCYPIRHDPIGSSIICAKNSLGMNIRVYKLTKGSYDLYTTKDKSIKDYEEWRDITYYEYIREKIIKTKQCPNFVLMHGFNVSENCKIDFDKIIKIKGLNPKHEPTYLKNNVNVVPVQHIPSSRQIQKGGSGSGIGSGIGSSNELVPNPDAYLGKALVAMTESPIYNLFGWASKTYQIDGNIKRQINTGFHLEKVWFTIIFQIMMAMYAMQKHKIYFYDFNPEDHIYIRDLNVFGTATKYWKYVVDGIEYYIPNYGYLVMIDTNYKDIVNSNSGVLDTLQKSNNINVKIHKLYAGFLEDTVNLNLTFNCFIKSIDADMFGKLFSNNGGCPPPPEVLTKLNSMKIEATKDTKKDIGPYISTHMRQFMNNRIGTFLKESEILNIRKNDQRKFTKGSLVVYEDGPSSYKFVMYMSVNDGKATILSKESPKYTDIIEVNVPITSLYVYSNIEPIMQTFKLNESTLNEDDLLETYVMNKDE